MKNTVVTGMGVLSTAGFTLKKFWDTLYQGKLSYEILDEFTDDPNFRIKIGAKIKSNSWSENINKSILDKYGKAACYSVSTAIKAIEDAGIFLSKTDKNRIAVVIGTTMGEIETEEEITRRLCSDSLVEDKLYQKYPTFNIVKAVAEEIGAKGYLYAIPAACAAGNYAVSIAKKLLDWNYADIVIVGGVDIFSNVAFAGFQRLLALAPDVCSPFDKNRKGLVIGEGCGIVIMEREYERRGQKIYGKILGSGLASNGYHMTAPHINGDAELNAMKKAIEDAGLITNKIDYISAHGTGTKLNDKTEAKAINDLFDKVSPPVSSIKSMIGHSMGAASMLELISSLLMIKYNTILPTVNYKTEDEDCNVTVVKNKPIEKRLEYILSNSFAFGGQTSSIVIGA